MNNIFNQDEYRQSGKWYNFTIHPQGQQCINMYIILVFILSNAKSHIRATKPK